jgi:hypothetical protein
LITHPQALAGTYQVTLDVDRPDVADLSLSYRPGHSYPLRKSKPGATASLPIRPSLAPQGGMQIYLPFVMYP